MRHCLAIVDVGSGIPLPLILSSLTVFFILFLSRTMCIVYHLCADAQVFCSSQ